MSRNYPGDNPQRLIFELELLAMQFLFGAFTSLFKLLYNTRYCTPSYRQVSSNSRYLGTILEHLTYCRPNSIRDMTTLLHDAVSLVRKYVEFHKKTPKQAKSFELTHDTKYSMLPVMITLKLCNEIFAYNTVVAHCAKVTSSYEEVLYVLRLSR